MFSYLLFPTGRPGSTGYTCILKMLHIDARCRLLAMVHSANIKLDAPPDKKKKKVCEYPCRTVRLTMIVQDLKKMVQSAGAPFKDN